MRRNFHHLTQEWRVKKKILKELTISSRKFRIGHYKTESVPKKTKTINSSIPLHLSNVSKSLLNNLRDQNKN